MSILVREEQAGEEQPEAPAPAESQQPAPLRTVLLRGALGTLQAAVVASLLLQASTLGLFLPRWAKDQFVDSFAFYADTAVLWVLLLLLWSVIGRLWWSIAVLIVIVLAVGIGTVFKLQMREEPVYPSDVDWVQQPEFLASMVSPLALVLCAGALVAVGVGAVRVGRRMDARYPRPSWRRLRRRHALAVLGLRCAVGVLAALLLGQTVHFNQPGNPWRALYEARGDHWRYWNQKTNYRSNGFVGGFLFNMPIEAMQQPQSYDAGRLDAVADRYERVAARINAHRTGSLDDVNVVLVLSESFTDPTELDGFDLDHDPIPRTRARMRTTTSGHMLAQLYGGGTANMEFEALTGQSLGLFRPQMMSPYQMLVPDQQDYPSAVGWFQHEGHDAIAVHPYRVGMYKREQVYERFGFDSFIHDTTIRSPRTIDQNPYISDDSAFDEVLAQIAEHDRPLMVNLVTMQNHIPVDDNYDDPLDVSGIGGGQARRIGQYARGLEHTDAALDAFLDKLAEGPEKTIVLFYGDHLPGIYGRSVKRQNPGLALYRTPFLIWSNLPDQAAPRTVPATSPAFFLPLLYEVADAPVPPYLALLDEVRRHVGVIQQGRLLDPWGERLAEADLDEESAQLLEDMRLVQFDFSIGDRDIVDRMWPGAVSRIGRNSPK